MKHIIIFHDAFVKPTDYWYAQIQSFIPNGYSVITPELPGGTEQGATFWMKSLDQYREIINEDTIIISHGISSLLTLRFVETLTKKIRSYVSVAGCVDAPKHRALSPIAETFLKTPFNWEIIKKNIPQVFHIWNTKDPFVEPDLSKRFLELLPGKKQQLSGVGHFVENQELELFTVLQSLFDDINLEDKQKLFIEKNQLEEEQKKNLAKSAIPSVVTYDTDVAKSIAGYQGKVISQMLEEARAREVEKKSASPTNPKNIFYIVGSIILISLSVLGIGYAYVSQIPKIVPLLKTNTNQYGTTLLRVEKNQPFEINSVENYQLKETLKTLQSNEVETKTFSAIVPLQQGTRTTLQDFVELFGIKFPVGFASQAKDFVYGYYQPSNDEKIPFLLIQFNGYDIIYQLMRNWEPDITNGMQLLFWPDEVATSLIKNESAEFNDALINNIPMRVGTTPSGKTIIYGFLTDETLLITPSTNLAEPLLRRMIGR